jgi:uncharacterized membrane protein
MNIHPILVHLPIGIFIVYAAMEILCLDKKFPSLRNGKRFLAIVGFVTGWITLATGEAAEHAIEANADRTIHKLVEAHATIAGAFVVVAGILAALSILSWIIEKYPAPTVEWQKIAHRFAKLNKRWIFIVLALIGLLLITVTGGLGGTIVYGPGLDPMTKLLYSIVVK